MTTKHTSGRWFADAKGNIWRRPPSKLYENGGGVAGDKPLAVAYAGWYGENDTGYPVEANARLIAAAPDLLNELLSVLDWAVTERAPLRKQEIESIRKVIAKATGEQP